MTDNSELNRLFWHSRRGMLELDLALVPFAREVYVTLPEEEKALYRQLLEREDTELFGWILQKSRPSDAGLALIVDKIIRYAQTRQD